MYLSLQTMPVTETKQQQFTWKSPLSAEQLRVLSLYHQCGVNLDNKTFLAVWKLASLGIPANVIVDLLRDVAAYGAKQ